MSGRCLLAAPFSSSRACLSSCLLLPPPSLSVNVSSGIPTPSLPEVPEIDLQEIHGFGWIVAKALVVVFQVCVCLSVCSVCLCLCLWLRLLSMAEGCDVSCVSVSCESMPCASVSVPLFLHLCLCAQSKAGVYTQVLSYPVWTALECCHSALLYCRHHLFIYWSQHVMLL